VVVEAGESVNNNYCAILTKNKEAPSYSSMSSMDFCSICGTARYYAPNFQKRDGNPVPTCI